MEPSPISLGSKTYNFTVAFPVCSDEDRRCYMYIRCRIIRSYSPGVANSTRSGDHTLGRIPSFLVFVCFVSHCCLSWINKWVSEEVRLWHANRWSVCLCARRMFGAIVVHTVGRFTNSNPIKICNTKLMHGLDILWRRLHHSCDVWTYELFYWLENYLARSAKVAERAICFTDRNFYLSFLFFNDFSETNYLKIRWTNFRNLYVEWKLFGRRCTIWTCFFDISRDVAIATDFMQKWQNSTFSSIWHSETVWGNAVYGQD